RGNKLLWAVGTTVAGDALIRGHPVNGDGERRFGLSTNPDAGLLLPGGGASAESDGWRDFPSTTRVRHPGCCAYQVDSAPSPTSPGHRVSLQVQSSTDERYDD